MEGGTPSPRGTVPDTAQAKVRHYLLAAYLSATGCFVLRSETGLGKGYADLLLEPFPDRPDELRHGYVIELKYLRRSDPKGGPQSVAQLAASQIEQAKAQLAQYLADGRLRGRKDRVRFTGIALVFHGWELVASAPADADSEE